MMDASYLQITYFNGLHIHKDHNAILKIVAFRKFHAESDKHHSSEYYQII